MTTGTWCAALAIAASLALSPSANAGNVTLAGTVSNVVDGDTFDVCDATLCTRIRLCGVNSPERGERGFVEAKAAMQALVHGKAVRCRQVGSGTPCDGRSKAWNNNRAVAQCFVGNEDVAAVMVRKGLACDWRKFSGGHYGGRSCP